MAMTFGYARVSTAGQTLDSQLDQLVAANVDRQKIKVEAASGARDDRPVLTELIEHLQEGDTIVVTKLDRLGRSVGHLIDLTTRLDARGVALRSLSEQINTSTVAGRVMVHMLAVLAQMERNLIRESTVAGLAAARARGRTGGVPQS
ncbi:recombinase family protein [Isoptericola sp. b515]|uniref:recombinase family protein n=1 Tax=Isoptericola sp. b515 TaxID=3064652 RepID=UPI00271295BE|nr:recombinase family protein [Isoptericola sp. b515]MDO8147419.1 recombinase family protein [Isoptericola sp. b515]